MVRSKVSQFCGVYGNIFRTPMSGAGDEDYIQWAFDEYCAEYEVPFTLLHAWIILKVSLK